ncbi:AAA family ATPase [Acinetobacter equi]|uniref:ATP-binding protein n=1 Tax=Acinetobacter equi TaxID=1324350 RepID=A0A0N9W0F6_9GAMM|nr:AAA family ATPase [Acinetobacter equi]ALH95052.1 ATP-binding protein [Acinetobacter equi]
MKIESIQLRHVTHFSNLTLNFNYHNKPITLIFGEQGSGKTSILKTTFQALTWFSARYKDLRTAGLVTLDQDISHNQQQTKIDITVRFPSEIGAFVESATNQEQDPHLCEWQLYKTLNQNNVGTTQIHTEKLEQLVKLYQKAIQKDKLQGLPLIAYYPVERFINEVNLLSKNNPLVFQTTNAYEISTIPYTTFSRFFEWFREISDIENAQTAQLVQHVIQDQRSEHPAINLSQHLLDVYTQMHAPSLQALKTAIFTVLTDVTAIDLNFHPKLQMIVCYKEKMMPFQQLPGSIRTWIALIGDVVRRLCLLNPHSLYPGLEGEGILLIDQIEHQLDDITSSQILTKLNEAFPRLQIIATTARNELLNDATDFQCLKLQKYQVQDLDAQLMHSSFQQIYNELHEVLNEESSTETITEELSQSFEITHSPESLLEFIQQHLNQAQQQVLIDLLNQHGNISIPQNMDEP